MVREEFIHRFREAKAKYLRAHLGSDKQSLEQEINEVKKQIALLTHGSASVIASDKEAISKGFDWVVEFAEVLAEGGFDIQVANPPYVRQELIKDLKPTLKQVYPVVYTGTSDLYCFFYARALQLLKTGGMLAFISSNKWFRAKYGEKLREHIADTCQVSSITDFGDLPLFESATAYPMIFIAQKQANIKEDTQFTQVQSLESPYPDIKTVINEQGTVLPNNSLNGKNWLLSDSHTASLINKMAAAGIPLGEYVNEKIYYGIKTGFNQAFVIDGAKRAELIAKDPKSTEIIKPLAVGADVRKWCIRNKDKYLIVTTIGIDIKKYPAIFEHLNQWKLELDKRYDKGKFYWELRACAYYAEFDKPKIVFPDIAKESRFSLDEKGLYINDTTFMIPVYDLYLLGVLNSLTVLKYYHQLSPQILGGHLRFKRQYIEKIPIPPASESEKETIIKLVQKCLDAKGVNCEEWEKEIDERVAALYGL
ncbi:conserved hypothetical protein [Microcystis aeruginosa PCC 7941]|nr:TaqI-like C-terminal specificity domain-containing protein [Microcystis aeruginosa]CCI06626.1 conserved hypothetical protein [Microcystis aeruginosa PCC 7941]